MPVRDTLAMTRCTRWLRSFMSFAFAFLGDAGRFLLLCLRPSSALAAENLFLRKQLALYQERQVKPRRATRAIRVTPSWLARWFDWQQALAVVTPQTLIRWHRQGFRVFWRLKSRPGRPLIPLDLQALIRQMVGDNPTWGQQRIAKELLLKLGLRVSPRAVRKYMLRRLNPGLGKRIQTHSWSTFVCNHAQATVACDFCVAITATFRILYVFVVIEHASRRLLHAHVTTRPTAEWALQHFREAIPSKHRYRFLIHDRDSIFSQALDQSIGNLGLQVLKTPVRTPLANAICERVLGTLRRECLDFGIPLTEYHRREPLCEWLGHYNTGRPHLFLRPGIAQSPSQLPVSLQAHRHQIPESSR
jgi:putative transposase